VDKDFVRHEYGMKLDPDLPFEAMLSFTESGDVIVAVERDGPISIQTLGGPRPVLSGQYRFYLKKGHPSPRFIDDVR